MFPFFLSVCKNLITCKLDLLLYFDVPYKQFKFDSIFYSNVLLKQFKTRRAQLSSVFHLKLQTSFRLFAFKELEDKTRSIGLPTK